jgi:hypothetical protein
MSEEKPNYEAAAKAALAEIEQYKKLCGKLWQALEFYAELSTYFAMTIRADPPCGEFYEDGSEVDGHWRPGKLARETLERAKEDYGELVITFEED